jgi:3-phenylpropionate/trans-cinnamate dioxygenase ferredoxin subunit
MTYELACAATDVSDDEALAVTIGAYDVAIARCVDPGGAEEFFALQDVCSHAAVSLSEGEVEDCTVECWLHGSRFDLRSGKPTSFPATEPVATFPVEVREDGVYVDVSTTLNGVRPT